jgi:hypothetical protein
MSSKVRVNRPWTSSYPFKDAIWYDNKIDQIMKLCRNHIASLDLGCPNMKLVTQVDGRVNTSNMTDREKYLEWVRSWKYAYRNLSELIRLMKMARRTTNLRRLPYPAGTNKSVHDLHLDARIRSGAYLERLQETAQVMLNARYNAKLASSVRRKLTL